MMQSIGDGLKRLLDSYAEPCVGDCEHSQCPLLRGLHALRIKAALEQARVTVKPFVNNEHEGERITSELMNMRLRTTSPVQASVPAKGEAVTTDRLRAALEDIASQRLRSEIEPRNGEVSGDFEGAYDIMINSARDALAAASPAAPVFDDWVAWLRYDFTNEETTGTTIRVCDSDAKGAFKVYRATAPASVPVAQPPTADAEMVALEIVKSLYNVNCFECSDVFCAHWQSESASIIYDALTAAEQRGRDERQERDMRAVCLSCAEPERFGPPRRIEGSTRWWHKDNKNSEYGDEACSAWTIIESGATND